ncbi:heterokaryon incompatibility protein-domain-containing protein [Cadophora sp. MPI-SDFR-AT-0126]|nr:heterokaryon incompatibility protein-domain-containing protein [Leotiomycetes sp. MPI-SDFR-AT-0126]
MASSADGDQNVPGPSASERPFPYPRIDPKTEIRILELSPPDDKALISSSSKDHGSKRSRLRGNFIIAKIAERPSYKALSYAWGEPVFDDEIEFPEGVLPITLHLGSALRHLRRKIGHRRLWVDAICINQSHDAIEKGHQVSLMASIYRNTEMGLVWLGDGSPMNAVCVDFFAQLSRTCSKHGIDANQMLIINGKTKFPPESISDFNDIAMEVLNMLSEVSMNELIKILLGQSWFQRLWTVQEMALPPKLLLLNGAAKLSYHDFMMAIMILLSLEKEEEWKFCQAIDQSGLQKARILCATRIRTQNLENDFKEPDILNFVISNYYRVCKEPKDRIYALLGICERGKIPITPHYDLSDADVFQQFATTFLSQGNIKLLQYAGLVNHTCQGRNVPSWVPDWACNRTRIETRILLHLCVHDPFKACGKAQPDIAFDKRDAAIVGLRGVLLDFVNADVLLDGQGTKEGIGHCLQNCENLLEQTAAIRLWNDLCNARYKRRLKYNTGEDVDAVVARTLILNYREYFRNEAGSSPVAGDFYLQCMKGWMRMNEQIDRCENLNCPINQDAAAAGIVSIITDCGWNRTLFTTEEGYIGVGSCNLEPGDAVVCFHGAQTPFLLRKIVPDKSKCDESALSEDDQDESAQRWQLVGDCYLHGFMDNECLGADFEGKDRMFWIA